MQKDVPACLLEMMITCLRKNYILTFIVFAVALISCSCNSETDITVSQTNVWDTAHSVVSPADTFLILDDYVDYFGRPNQITHKAFVDGTKEIHFLYKPIKMESLIGIDDWADLDSNKIEQAEKAKKGYQFFEIWYKDNQPSISQESAKKETLACLLAKATIIANTKDTLAPMKEQFKSSVAGQPSKILLIVRDFPKDSLYKINVNGCGIRDFELEISKKQILNLPRLKLAK